MNYEIVSRNEEPDLKFKVGTAEEDYSYLVLIDIGNFKVFGKVRIITK